jgi:hypothetical protein
MAKGKCFYRVAVYWEREHEYGGSHEYETLAEAEAEAQRLLRLGYGKTKLSPVHIRKITPAVTVRSLTIDDLTPTTTPGE